VGTCKIYFVFQHSLNLCYIFAFVTLSAAFHLPAVSSALPSRLCVSWQKWHIEKVKTHQKWRHAPEIRTQTFKIACIYVKSRHYVII